MRTKCHLRTVTGSVVHPCRISPCPYLERDGADQVRPLQNGVVGGGGARNLHGECEGVDKDEPRHDDVEVGAVHEGAHAAPEPRRPELLFH